MWFSHANKKCFLLFSRLLQLLLCAFFSFFSSLISTAFSHLGHFRSGLFRLFGFDLFATTAKSRWHISVCVVVTSTLPCRHYCIFYDTAQCSCLPLSLDSFSSLFEMSHQMELLAIDEEKRQSVDKHHRKHQKWRAKQNDKRWKANRILVQEDGYNFWMRIFCFW